MKPFMFAGYSRSALLFRIAPALVTVTVLAFLVTSPGPNSNPGLLAWDAVGGCGAGGSGGAGGGAAKWIGKGVSGGLLNLQTMVSSTFGQDYSYFTFHNRFSYKPTWKTDLGLGIPLVSKSGSVQYRANQQDKTYVTGGLGDLSLDASYSFGSIGQYSATFSTTLPSGQYDIKRGPDGGQTFMTTSLQKGTGVYNTSLMLSYSKDSDDGMLMADLSYTHPVAMRLFSGENAFLGDYYKDYTGIEDNERFYYRFKPYGENDIGDYFPPSVTLACYYAYRGHESRVQSIGFNFSVPIGVAWIHSEKVGVYDPKPDPDFKRWSATLHYGYEFSNDVFPVYFAFNLPIFDKKNPSDPGNEYNEEAVSKWDGPDWSNLFQTGSVYLGFKSTFF